MSAVRPNKIVFYIASINIFHLTEPLLAHGGEDTTQTVGAVHAVVPGMTHKKLLVLMVPLALVFAICSLDEAMVRLQKVFD